MSTTSVRLRQIGKLPRNRRELWLIGLAFLAIVAWGWIGVDTSIIDEMSSTLSKREKAAWAAGEFDFRRSRPSTAALTAGGSQGEGPPVELVAQGAAVFEAMGCNACHSLDGSQRIGPSLLGLWGTEQIMEDGAALLMDDAYFRESVLQPQARIVSGYTEAAMPSYEGLVSDEDLDMLAAYLQSLR